MTEEKEFNSFSNEYLKYIESLLVKPVLNLGCGVVKFYSFNAMNVDYNPNIKPDILYDLNVFPYPFDDSSYNTIVMLHVLEHLKYPEKVIEECYRILKQGGKLIIAFPSERSENYHHPTHIQFFTKSILKDLVSIFPKTKVFGYRGDSHEVPSWLGKLIGIFAHKVWMCMAIKS